MLPVCSVFLSLVGEFSQVPRAVIPVLQVGELPTFTWVIEKGESK